MLGEQTLKKFEVVVQRECEGCFFGFLGFGFSLLLAFPTASCCFLRGIDSELNDKLGLEAAGSKVFFIRHDAKVGKMKEAELVLPKFQSLIELIQAPQKVFYSFLHLKYIYYIYLR